MKCDIRNTPVIIGPNSLYASFKENEIPESVCADQWFMLLRSGSCCAAELQPTTVDTEGRTKGCTRYTSALTSVNVPWDGCLMGPSNRSLCGRETPRSAAPWSVLALITPSLSLGPHGPPGGVPLYTLWDGVSRWCLGTIFWVSCF